MALSGFNALSLTCAAIDILETDDGFKIIEANNGIMMDGFAATNKEYYEIAKSAHREMLMVALNKTEQK